MLDFKKQETSKSSRSTSKFTCQIKYNTHVNLFILKNVMKGPNGNQLCFTDLALYHYPGKYRK